MLSFLKKSPPKPDTKRSEVSWIKRLKFGLARTSSQLTDLFSRGGQINDDLYEELETILITLDVCLSTTHSLLADLRLRVKEQHLSEATQLKEALKHCLL